MLELLSGVETPPDPIWLRTLSTVLPVAGAIAVAALTGQKVVERFREKKERDTPPPADPAESVAVVAVERSSTDPILRLFIEDLHNRLSEAHTEAAQLHQFRAVDAGTIARLSAELTDKEERLSEVEQELERKTTQNRVLRGRLEQLNHELESTRHQLALCLEGSDPR